MKKTILILAVTFGVLWGNNLLQCRDKNGYIIPQINAQSVTFSSLNNLHTVISVTTKRARDKNFSEREFLAVWVTTIYSEQAYKKNKIGYDRVLYLIDVDNDEYVVADGVKYGCNGNVISSFSNNDLVMSRNFSSIIPDSMGSWIRDEALRLSR